MNLTNAEIPRLVTSTALFGTSGLLPKIRVYEIPRYTNKRSPEAVVVGRHCGAGLLTGRIALGDGTSLEVESRSRGTLSACGKRGAGFIEERSVLPRRPPSSTSGY